MNILMISDVYFPRVNGVCTSIKSFREQLVDLGHKVTLIAPEYPADQKEDGADIIRIASRYLVVDPEDRILRYGHILRLIPQLRQQNYDVLHIQTPFIAHYAGLRLAKELGLPTVETYHTFFEEYLFHYVPWLPKSWLKAAARGFTRSQCNKVDALIVPSRPMLEVMQRYGVTQPMHIIPTGLHLDEFAGGDGPTFRRQYGIEDQRPVMAFVGRIAHEKNIDFLLKVLVRVVQKLPNALLVVAGEGPAVPHIKKMVARLGLTDNVLMVGYLDRESQLLDCYRAADLFVFSSKTETQGLVVLEAMAVGTPVVSTAYMGTKDVLVDGQGAWIAEDDEQDFADKVHHLLSNPEERVSLGRKGQDYLQQWTASQMTQNMLELYSGLIATKMSTT